MESRCILLVLLFLLCHFAYGQDDMLQRMNDVESQLSSVESQLQKLDAEKNALREFVNLIFWLIGGTVGFITIFSTASQVIQSRASKRDTAKYLKLVNEQNEKLNQQLVKYQDYLQNQDNKFQSLLDKVKDNIEKTTGFVGSLDEMFRLSGKAQELDQKFEELLKEGERRAEEDKEEARRKRQKRVSIAKALNAKAMRISSKVRKHNYSSNYNTGQYREFNGNASPILAIDDDSQSEKLNGSVYFVVALDAFINGQYKDALINLEKADKSFDLVDPNSHSSGDYYFPEIPIIDKYGSIQKWIEYNRNFIFFIKGLVYFRTGAYQVAETHFNKASDYDAKDNVSKLFSIESKYWGQYASFEAVITSFENLLEIIKDGALDISKSTVYNFIGNCYFHTNLEYTPYPSKKDAEKAAKFYQLADREILLNESRPKYLNYRLIALIPFSRAQSLEYISLNTNNSSSKLKVKDLFEKAIQLGYNQLQETDNYFNQYILNYILAYSFFKLGDTVKSERHLISLQEDLREFATIPKFIIFSPVSKRMLDYSNLKKELQDLREKLA